jgi:hypothetical protein
MFDTIGHGQLSPDDYQYLWTAALAGDCLAIGDPLRELLMKETIKHTKLADGINAVSLVRNFIQSIGGGAKHNSDACSPDLRDALKRFRWFDSPGARLAGLFCDAPLHNLIVDLLVGVYGYPYHVNLKKLKRFEYMAKETPMYTDVFVLDQCRYMYDLVPTIPLLGKELPLDLQLQLRVCMNLIRLHAHESCWDLFRGSALAGAEVQGFCWHSWPARKLLR